MTDKIQFPEYLNTFGDLKDHFGTHFEGLLPYERGNRFVRVAQSIVPFTNFGRRGFKEPELQQESHDEGIDLISEHPSNSDLLCIQSKYTIPDKSAIDSIISKFQDFSERHYRDSAGPLFAHGGVILDDEPTVYFQIITTQNLERILKKYEASQFTSLSFYSQLRESKRIEVVDGPKILEILRTAYRKANVLPSDFELEFEAGYVRKDNVYIGILSSSELRRLYSYYGDSLFYENVRSFLARRERSAGNFSTTINEEIIGTVRNEADQFLARNNGIVIKAREIEALDARKLRLRESSVVNGCQTTMCVVGYTDDDNECSVLVKVVGTEEAWDIARAANLQNDVSRFELVIAQFLRPQIVNKAASYEGYRVIGNESAFALLDSIYQYEIMYDDLRSLFVGIFSRSPNNIFDTSYLELLPDLIGMFYENDSEGGVLLSKLFQIQQAANRSMTRLQEKMKEKSITLVAYQRFFKDNKAAYRAFFTLLAACAISKIDISERFGNLEERFKLIDDFLTRTISVIENNPKKFELYYRFAMQACSSIIPPQKDRDEIKQLLWQTIRRANFSALLERMELEALNHEL